MAFSGVCCSDLQPLCMKNYYSRFSTLLHLEEIQRDMDMRNFDLFRESH